MAKRKEFIIGVFMDDEVPTDGAGSNATQVWKRRGCTTSFLVPQNHDVAGWDFRNTVSGLRVVRSYANTPPANTNGLGLQAVASDVCPDEPDEHGGNVDQLIQETQGIRLKCPGVPLYQSVGGGKILGMEGATYSDADYTRLLAAYDWVATDIYPVTGWGLPGKLGMVYDAQMRLKQLAPHARRFAFIECSNQRLSWVPADATDAGAPTAAHMAAEVYLALIADAEIIWFAESIGQWAFDNTNAAEQNAMAELNSLIAAHSDFLVNGTLVATVNPTATLYRGDWTLNGKVFTLTVDLSGTAPVMKWEVGAVSATTSPTPTPTPTVIPSSLAAQLDGAVLRLKSGEVLTLSLSK